jgi:hypothetical protein
MNLLAKTFPVLLIKMGCAQTPANYSAQKIDYGFTTSTFTGITANSFVREKYNNIEISNRTLKTLSAFNYGWKQGLFLWVNFNSCFSYKPELSAVVCINNYKNLFSSEKAIYSTSAGIEFKSQLIIRLGCWNSQPIIKLARNMSYYLEGKQSYLIIGPKFSFQKADKAFLKLNNDKYTAIGLVIGGGVDNLFLNLDVAPEVLFSVEYKTGNYFNGSNNSDRYYASMSLAMNFF